MDVQSAVGSGRGVVQVGGDGRKGEGRGRDRNDCKQDRIQLKKEYARKGRVHIGRHG